MLGDGRAGSFQLQLAALGCFGMIPAVPVDPTISQRLLNRLKTTRKVLTRSYEDFEKHERQARKALTPPETFWLFEVAE